MSKVYTLKLNQSEFDTVCIQDPDSRGDGGFQSLMVTLQDITNESTFEMLLPENLIPRLRKYAFQFKNGGWEDRIIAIFSRHLGPNLDQLPPEN
jgi:hypothetical protein